MALIFLIALSQMQTLYFRNNFGDLEFEAVVSMTTIPTRSAHPWVAANIKNMLLTTPNNLSFFLNIPRRSKAGEEYIIHAGILELQSARFHLNRDCIDEGPATKILPTLRSSKIKDSQTIIVLDDDIIYYPSTFSILMEAVRKQPDAVHAMCSPVILGYQGFAFKKRTLLGLISLDHPTECEYVDDDILDYHVRNVLRIPIKATSRGPWFCSFDKKQSETSTPTSEWPELQFHTDRRSLQKKCVQTLRDTYK